MFEGKLFQSIGDLNMNDLFPLAFDWLGIETYWVENISWCIYYVFIIDQHI